MNVINVIAPYRWHSMWVFDDPRVGLVQEPFVAGADTMIDRVVADNSNSRSGLKSAWPLRLRWFIAALRFLKDRR
jgi:hypothetical protein